MADGLKPLSTDQFVDRLAKGEWDIRGYRVGPGDLSKHHGMAEYNLRMAQLVNYEAKQGENPYQGNIDNPVLLEGSEFNKVNVCNLTKLIFQSRKN